MQTHYNICRRPIFITKYMHCSSFVLLSDNPPPNRGLKPTKTICLARESVIWAGFSMGGLAVFYTENQRIYLAVFYTGPENLLPWWFTDMTGKLMLLAKHSARPQFLFTWASTWAAWASSKHGGWLPTMSIPTDSSRYYQFPRPQFMQWHSIHFHHTLFDKQTQNPDSIG